MALTKKAALKKLIKLFGPNGEKWCQGNYAVDKNGISVNHYSRKAVRFCIDGGVSRVSGKDVDLYVGLLDAIADQVPKGQSLVSFNDSRRSFAPVKKLLEKTLAAA